MTTYTWIGGASGSWNDPSKWSPATGFPNGFADEAFIPAGATVTIVGASYALGDLQLAAGATVAVTAGGTLALYPPGTTSDAFVWNGTISVDATSTLEFLQSWTTAQLGSIQAASGATLFFANGLDNTGATLTLTPGVLLRGVVNGGTIAGAINLAASAFLTLEGAPTLTGAGGSGAGVVNETASGSTFRLQDTETLANTTITIGNATNADFLSAYDSDQAGHVVTLASDVTVNVSQFATFTGSNYAGDALDNKGAVNVTGTAGYLTILAPTFNNEGTIAVANGDYLLFSNNSALTNTGTITVDATSFVQFQGLTTAQLGSFTASAGATVDFAGAGLDNTGAVFTLVDGVDYEGEITGGTLDGAVNIAVGQTLTLAGAPIIASGFVDDANSASTLQLGSTQTLDNFTLLIGNSTLSQINAATTTTFGSNVKINLLGNSVIQGPGAGSGIVNEGSISLSIGLASQAHIFGNSGGFTFTNEGSISISNNDSFVVDNSVTFKNAVGATISTAAASNGAPTILFQTDVENDGTITAAGFDNVASEIEFYYANTGTGVVDITSGGLANFFQSMTQHADFTGAGTLQLDSNVNSGTVSHFGAGDAINLVGLQWEGTSDSWSLDSSTDKLTVTEGSASAVIQLDPTGNYSNYVFTLADDRDGLTPTGTVVTAIPCFCRGTLIETDRGQVAVEDLRVGDLVPTASGALRPVRWIGHRSLDTARHPSPRDVYPVRVRKDAFGDGLPRRDLWLSPGHNIAFDGALMPANALLNGLSVQQVERARVEYWHVELDAHDIVLAEGLEVESYLDTGNRTGFENGGVFVEAHPDFLPKHWAATCLPLVKQGPQVSRARAQLTRRLLAQGYALDSEAEAFLQADGARIEPIRLSPSRLAFVAPEGARALKLVSNVFVPLHSMEASLDLRELGLSVARLQIDGEAFALDRVETLGAGWHGAEHARGAFSHRWTAGAADLPAGARLVVVELAGQGLYWREPKVDAIVLPGRSRARLTLLA